MSWLTHLLRRTHRATTTRRPVRPARNWRPALEHLEDRLQPAFAGLGTAAGFGVLGLQNTWILNNKAVVAGNAGVSQGGFLLNMPASTVSGDVREAAAGLYLNLGKQGGAVISDAAGMATADADALKASSEAAALKPTQSFARINKPTTVKGNGGVNVIAVNGDVKDSLTLSGTAKDVFIVNVSGNLNLSGKETLGLAGGVTASHVLFNFTGGNGSVQADSAVYGTLLAPGYAFSLSGTVTGEVIGSKLISLNAGAKVNFAPFLAPAPAQGATLSGHVLDDGGNPMSGVTVNLYNDAGNLVGSATTDDSGAYSFTNLAAGTYTLKQVVPAGYFSSYSTAGTVNGVADGIEDGESIGSIALKAGDSGVGYDFTNGFMGF